MHLVKLSVLSLAIVLVVSCSQQEQTKNIKNTAANAPATSVTVANKATSAENTTVGKVSKVRSLKEAQIVEPMQEVEEQPDKGLYEQNCMTCHKDTGKGGKVTINGKSLNAADLTSEKMKKHSDEELFKHISAGVPDEGMPAFKEKLSGDQIRSVVAQVRGLQSK